MRIYCPRKTASRLAAGLALGALLLASSATLRADDKKDKKKDAAASKPAPSQKAPATGNSSSGNSGGHHAKDNGGGSHVNNTGGGYPAGNGGETHGPVSASARRLNWRGSPGTPRRLRHRTSTRSSGRVGRSRNRPRSGSRRTYAAATSGSPTCPLGCS